MVFSGRKEVPYSEIKKGYEIAKDQYVMIEKQDLEKIAVESTSTINIKEFIDERELLVNKLAHNAS